MMQILRAVLAHQSMPRFSTMTVSRAVGSRRAQPRTLARTNVMQGGQIRHVDSTSSLTPTPFEINAKKSKETNQAWKASWSLRSGSSEQPKGAKMKKNEKKTSWCIVDCS